MNVLVAGGTGFVGQALCPVLRREGHDVTVVTRNPQRCAPLGGVRYVAWEGEGYERALAQADGVVNLAGESLARRRWTTRQRQLIRDSRVGATRRLAVSMESSQSRSQVLINASAVGYYGPRGDEELAESGGAGCGFLAELCREWEAEAQRIEGMGVRVVRLRIGLVLGPAGGALAKMVPLFRMFLGGAPGSGRQWVSWIHLDDVIGLVEWALARRDVAGAVNATAPHPARMQDVCRSLGRALRRPAWAPMPSSVLRLALGDMADLLLTGQRVIPEAAMRWGYAFRYPELDRAVEAVLRSTRR